MGIWGSKDVSAGEMQYEKDSFVPEDPNHVSLAELGADGIDLNVKDDVRDIAEYCAPFIGLDFYGETNTLGVDTKDGTIVCNQTDNASTCEVLNLGKCLKMMDQHIKNLKEPTDLDGDNAEFKKLLDLIVYKRQRNEKSEVIEQCSKRLSSQVPRFVEIYHKRNIVSEKLEHDDYWG